MEPPDQPHGPASPLRLARDPVYDVPAPHVCPQPRPARGAPTSVSLRDRLLLTQPVWLQLSLNSATALHILQREPPGTFLVRRSNTRQRRALCLRLLDDLAPAFVASYSLQEGPAGVSLEGSSRSFPDLLHLVASYCQRREVLPVALRLPQPIQQAVSHKELESISHLGLEFWSSSLNAKDSPELPEPQFSEDAAAGQLGTIPTRSPRELDCGLGNGALGFLNPLFQGKDGGSRRDDFKRSIKVRVSTETSSPLSPPPKPPPPIPANQAGTPPTPRREPGQCSPLCTSGYRVPQRAGEPLTAEPARHSLPSLQELDSGSPSGSESEGGGGPRAPSPPAQRRPRAPLRSMSDAVLAVLAPEKQLARAVEGLARDRSTRLGASIQDFLTLVRGGKGERSSHELLSPVRAFLTRTKTQMLQSPALELPSPTLLPDHRLDAVLERALHRCVLKPLKPVLASRLRGLHVADGSLGQLRENLRLVRERGPGAFPARATLPGPPDTQRARHKLLRLLRAYSPCTQVTLLLQACKGVYRAMGAAPDGSYGADEFLPVLSFILAQCDLPQLLMEAEYMMELMEPSQLLGEGGYYLTTLQASLALLGSFHEEKSRQLRPDVQRVLSWRHQHPTGQLPGDPCWDPRPEKIQAPCSGHHSIMPALGHQEMAERLGEHPSDSSLPLYSEGQERPAQHHHPGEMGPGPGPPRRLLRKGAVDLEEPLGSRIPGSVPSQGEDQGLIG
ncbi:ras and Rab interactor 1 isoform X2 [Pelodiscus sinensis]|uniref:ras and Rab interactor 1 isoform X2 n=1 Tax=Pelodiscus sinensis TaxID=13735 RepID=UPI003F6A5762